MCLTGRAVAAATGLDRPRRLVTVATFDLDEREAYRRDILPDLVGIGLPIAITGSEQRTLDHALLSLGAGRRTVAR